MVKFLFRIPVFPILVETDYRVFGIYTNKDFDRLVKRQEFSAKKMYTVVDSTGEGWVYMDEHDVISPFILHKRWYKKEIINFFNNSLSELGIKNVYVGRSLSAKKVSIIIEEIVLLSRQIEKEIKNS